MAQAAEFESTAGLSRAHKSSQVKSRSHTLAATAAAAPAAAPAATKNATAPAAAPATTPAAALAAASAAASAAAPAAPAAAAAAAAAAACAMASAARRGPGLTVMIPPVTSTPWSRRGDRLCGGETAATFVPSAASLATSPAAAVATNAAPPTPSVTSTVSAPLGLAAKPIKSALKSSLKSSLKSGGVSLATPESGASLPAVSVAVALGRARTAAEPLAAAWQVAHAHAVCPAVPRVTLTLALQVAPTDSPSSDNSFAPAATEPATEPASHPAASTRPPLSPAQRQAQPSRRRVHFASELIMDMCILEEASETAPTAEEIALYKADALRRAAATTPTNGRPPRLVYLADRPNQPIDLGVYLGIEPRPTPPQCPPPMAQTPSPALYPSHIERGARLAASVRRPSPLGTAGGAGGVAAAASGGCGVGGGAVAAAAPPSAPMLPPLSTKMRDRMPVGGDVRPLKGSAGLRLQALMRSKAGASSRATQEPSGMIGGGAAGGGVTAGGGGGDGVGGGSGGGVGGGGMGGRAADGTVPPTMSSPMTDAGSPAAVCNGAQSISTLSPLIGAQVSSLI